MQLGLVAIYAVSDSIIAASYLAIALTFAYLIWRARRDVPFHWMLLPFGVFIIACGGTHLLDVVTLWTPANWLSGVLKVVTAVASITTAIALPTLIPRALTLIREAKRAGERKADLEQANVTLEVEVRERVHAERALQREIELIELLQAVSSASTEAASASIAIETVLAEICERTDWRTGHVYLRELGAETELLPPGIWHLASPDGFASIRAATGRVPLADGVGLAGTVSATAVALWVDDVTTDSRFVRRSADETASVKAYCAVPVLEGQAVVGVLELFSDEPLESDDRLLSVLKHCGMQLGRVVERMRAKRAMEQQAVALRNQARLLDATHETIVARDLDGVVRFWNRGAEEMFGWTRDEATGRSMHELLDTVFPQPLEEITETIWRDGRWAGDLRKTTKDGRALVLESRWALQKGSPGEGDSVLEVSIDVTARRHAEAEQVRLAGELEIERARLERSNRELEGFAFVASHDLQEPLRKIQAFGDVLKRSAATALDAKALDYLDRMQSAARRMQRLIEDLLDFSRVGTKAGRFTRVDLERVAREVVSDLEVRVRETGGRVEIGALPVLDAEPLQMRQLIQNLIANALKFRREGEPPVVRVYAEEAPADPGTMRLVVEDNGIGFDEKYLDRIFNVFQRLHARSQYEGTGIGLAICRKIAERHNGSITARSRPGEGATFVVTLPKHHSDRENLT